MKIFRNLITVILLASGSLAVQAQDRPLVRANVPFAFTVANVAMPAGNYTISSIANNDRWVTVQSADGRHVAIILTTKATTLDSATHSKLVFQQIGSEYFLNQVWQRGEADHLEVRNGKRAALLAKNGKVPQLVTVLATSENEGQS